MARDPTDGPSRGLRWTMAKLSARLAIAAWLTCIVVGALYSFWANDTFDYYASRPERLLYVLAITLAVTAVGALAVFLFYRWSPAAQRRAALLALGTVAALFTLLFGCAVVFLAPALLHEVWQPLAVAAWDRVMAILALLICVAGPGALAALLWYDCYRLRKTGRTRFLRRLL